MLFLPVFYADFWRNETIFLSFAAFCQESLAALCNEWSEGSDDLFFCKKQYLCARF